MSKRLLRDVLRVENEVKRNKPIHNNEIVSALKETLSTTTTASTVTANTANQNGSMNNGHSTDQSHQRDEGSEKSESSNGHTSEQNGEYTNQHAAKENVGLSNGQTSIQNGHSTEHSELGKTSTTEKNVQSSNSHLTEENGQSSIGHSTEQNSELGNNHEAGDIPSTSSDGNQSLVGFQQTRILMNDPKSKRVHVLGKFKDDEEDAIITMVKTPFSQKSVNNILSNQTMLHDDDSCGSCSATTRPSNNSINTQIIKPASSRHIMKYTERRPFLIFETPEIYNDVTKPYLDSHRYGVQWVYNILDHIEETERIAYEDPDKTNGFVLIPCVKWDMKQTEDMFMIALVQRRDLTCLRDLNAEHLPMLKNILNKGMETITTKYNLKSSQIRAYLHYLPSYEHLHVNFTHLMHDSGGVQTEKAHLLHDVIYNIENISSDFYEKRTLPVKLYERDPLLDLLFNAVGMF